jgi:hypothetical protein
VLLRGLPSTRNSGQATPILPGPSLAATGLGGRDGQGDPTGLTLGPDRTLYVALYGGAPFDGPSAVVVSLAADACAASGGDGSC